ncbi:zinc carboxypeptidase [Chlorella sorokiniana]|uniref:Zinc carboxypeptidase n=1 Tax=Chlorella sorokiniana TaxID=3076 RepID=A0A2P6TJ76_CHLSO|nr:zinc carboxypeptidase [Chlorella sorokiniana]|eukprot:PRW39306.1 zinc carboxypeptidase [Chlorella sorokiniana]
MAARAAVQQQAETQRWASEGTNRSCRGRSTMGVFVNSNYDSGNIDVVRITNPLDHVTHEVELKIHSDPYCEKDKREHSQWFYFRVSNCADETLNVRILNAGQCSYPSAWKGYSVCTSYDKKHWFRVPTSYDEASGVLSWTHTPAKGNVYYAYFAPYSYERHQELVAEMQCQKGVTLEMLGETLDGHDLDLLRVGTDGEGKRRIWVVARQHPGESMAEWFAEGMLRRLLDRADPVSRSLLRDTVFYVVPCMCPDGVFRGHLRTNAAGANLNREWAAPSAEESPEVLLVLKEMEEVGCDLLVDVHGDEELPYVFVAGNQGIPAWGPRLAGLHDAFCQAFKAASPDFQTKYGYPVAKPNTANLSLCSKQIGQKFDCLAVTLEMPFKDNANLPCPEQGWSPERSMKLGGAMLEAVLAVTPQLR